MMRHKDERRETKSVLLSIFVYTVTSRQEILRLWFSIKPLNRLQQTSLLTWYMREKSIQVNPKIQSKMTQKSLLPCKIETHQSVL